ncbi:S35E1-like protein [Mya arenaria]|uniref:S35E1-like protein n=1 Tax=Mya arenaria TaxID=6604 RepID=A0ABY7FRI1_MYAAR|nr:S35E1-like protein [Mya arenaria]
MNNQEFFHALKLVIVCMMWYASSASGNVIGKLVLNEFPYPMTMTMVQLSSAALYLGPILSLLGVPKTGEISRRYYLTMIIPLAFGKFISSVSSHIMKATLPLFTVILMRLCFKEKQTLPVYFSLLPIIGGVCIATVTEISFDLIGLLSALFATLGFSLQTIFSKKIQHDNKLMAVLLIMLDGLFNMLQNVFAFTVLAMVNPLSYAVANATKRVVIIGASLMLLRNPVSTSNVMGMLVAVFGVLLYNWAKYYQRLQSERERVLPYIQSDSDLQSLVHTHETLPHSKTEINLNKNGVVYNNVFLENLPQYEHVTLIPVPANQYESRQNNEELHSRGSHSVFHV